jgi:hypothetical protein
VPCISDFLDIKIRAEDVEWLKDAEEQNVFETRFSMFLSFFRS